MKKFLSILLVLVMCVSVFAACNDDGSNMDDANNNQTTAAGNETPGTNDADDKEDNKTYDLAGAKEYVKQLNKTLLSNNVTNKNFELLTRVMKGDDVYTIDWSVNNNAITVEVDAASNKATIKVPANPTEEISYKLTATIKAPNGTSDTLVFDLKVVPSQGPAIMTTPVEGVAYKMFMEQTNLNKTLYFTGAMNGYYFATSENPADGADMYIEATEGGYYIYFEVDSAKKYLSMTKSGTHINAVFGDAPNSVFTWNSEYNTFIGTVEDETYFFGTYDNYQTFGTSKEANLAKGDYMANFVRSDSDFPTVPDSGDDKPTTPDVTAVTSPEVGVEYKMFMKQGNLNKTLYFTGEMDGYFYATSESADSAVAVYLESAEGGYYIYFEFEGNKKYLSMTKSGTHINAVFGDDPDSVFTWNTEYNTFITSVDGGNYFFGTYSNYKTIGTSAEKYFAQGNFYAQLVLA